MEKTTISGNLFPLAKTTDDEYDEWLEELYEGLEDEDVFEELDFNDDPETDYDGITRNDGLLQEDTERLTEDTIGEKETD
jgi:hypothetical protein